MMTNLQQEIKNVLDQFPKYWDNGILLKNQIIEDVRNYQPEVLAALLKNQTIQQTYSLEVNGLNIFKVEEFISMLRYKNYLENSYTKYSNEIGLTTEGKYLKYTSDIVLEFPHKDGILEGRMKQEDIKEEEVYYHNILAKEEIDILLSPKVLKNIKKYGENGFQKINQFSSKDNLIIKGNNLIALHTLKERYSGKVKLIYIDPPYNTGNDSFNYNDQFSHSTWLTFMRNRIMIAKELLRPDGSIWINIDDNESHYLKVLVDEIFGRENFVANVIWEKKFSPQNDAKWFSNNHDHILIFAKNKELWSPNQLSRTEKMNSRYRNVDNDPRGPWTSGDLSVKTYNKNTDYTIITPSGKEVNPPKNQCWRVSKEKLDEMILNNRIWFGENGENVPRIKRFLSEVKDGMTPTTIWTQTEVGHNQEAKREVNKIDDVAYFSTPKPERLLKRIIHIGSKKDDLILDFFMGSATTQAVAMKMDRQFIGIEQMDYINEVSIPRLQKVIEGEQGGISKDVEWQGGGDFVYAELSELNQFYIKDIQRASNTIEIERVIQTIKDSGFLNIKVDLEKLLQQKEAFFKLTLEEQKSLLIQVLDNNQLYLSYSEIDDDQYTMDEQTKSFNHSFYLEGV